jgi:hypothetical protein
MPRQVTTSTVGTQVQITLTPPDNNGDEITSFNVLIKQNDTHYSNSSECDASLIKQADGNYTCKVSFTTLRRAPFNLKFLDIIKVKFNAVNVIG